MITDKEINYKLIIKLKIILNNKFKKIKTKKLHSFTHLLLINTGNQSISVQIGLSTHVRCDNHKVSHCSRQGRMLTYEYQAFLVSLYEYRTGVVCWTRLPFYHISPSPVPQHLTHHTYVTLSRTLCCDPPSFN